MTSFPSIPPLNLHNAPSTQCTFSSPVFVRALMSAITARDLETVHAGLDKALQLGLSNQRGVVVGDAGLLPSLAATAGDDNSNNGKKSIGGAQKQQRNSSNKNKERIDSLLDEAIATTALPLMCPLKNTHPTLSLYGEWVNFCCKQRFTTLQAQHCLVLLTELLDALGATDPEFEPSPQPQQPSQPPQTGFSLSEPTTGRDHLDGSVSDLATTTNSVLLPSSASPYVAANCVSVNAAPPEIVVEALTSFLARSCSRRTILVLDHDKIAEAAAAAAAAAAALAEASPPREMNAKGARGGRGGANNSNSNKPPAANKNKDQHHHQHESSTNAGSPNSKADEQQIQQQQLMLQAQQHLQQQQQQHSPVTGLPILRDPHPHVKEVTVDPVFTAAEVREICKFTTETIFQHWRLVAVLQRAPDGLTVPFEANVVVEPIPSFAVPRNSEGTNQRQYSDTQARLKALAEAEQTLQQCFDAALAERDATILPEYERSTSVASRRDRVIREDDMRKQMKPEEFKRTVRVLGKVMDPEVIMKQLAVAAAAKEQQQKDKAEAAAVAVAPAPSAAPPVLTLEQRLERLEKASLPQQNVSPGGSHARRHHSSGHHR